MATIDDMIEMVNTLEDEKKGWSTRTICGKPLRFPGSLVKSIMWRALYVAEDEGSCHNDYYEGVLCTCWVVGDYNIFYITDDEDFSVTMLTEEMMDEMIIEEV